MSAAFVNPIGLSGDEALKYVFENLEKLKDDGFYDVKDRLQTLTERLTTALQSRNENEAFQNVHQLAAVGNRIGRLLPESCLKKQYWKVGDAESKKRYEDMVKEVEAHVTKGFDVSFHSWVVSSKFPGILISLTFLSRPRKRSSIASATATAPFNGDRPATDITAG